MENVRGWVLSLVDRCRGGLSLPVMVSVACVALSALAGCRSGPPERQDPVSVRGSTRAEILPEAKSIQDKYRPEPLGAPPNPRVKYHVPPVPSYEDRPLSDNICGAIELADFEAAVIRAGYWPYLTGDREYTVLAVPNGPFEAYKHQAVPDLMRPSGHEFLKGFVGQMILVGHWDLPAIQRKAARRGGSIQVPTLAGPGHDVVLRPTAFGNVEVVGKDGTVTLVGNSYPQSNGVLYVTDSILPYQ